MSLVPLFQIDSALAARETYSFEVTGHRELPDGQYGIVEAYCPDPACDCRRVMLNVVARRDFERGKFAPLAAISYGFDREAEHAGPFLDPLNRQSKHADFLLEIVKRVLAKPEYVARLERHYRLVKSSAVEALSTTSSRVSGGAPDSATRAPKSGRGRPKNGNASPDVAPSSADADTRSVPLGMRPTFEEVTKIAEAFCREHLDEEYAQLSRKLIAALCRKRPSPLQQGQARVWACAAVYALGSNNFLWDKSESPHLSATELCERFGVGKSTASSKARQIADALNVRPFDPRWFRASRMDDNPVAWMVEINGFIVDVRSESRALQEEAFRRGLIPFIPGSR
jgi:hypothetical protein